MNDNQYLAHGAIICHSGVKGMKWGKHLKSAGEWIDKNITGKSAAEDARSLRGVAGYYDRRSAWENEARKNAPDSNDKMKYAQQSQGHKNEANAWRASAASYQKQSDNALFNKAKKTGSNISNAIGNGYKIVKTKAGQLFGKPKATSSTVTHQNDGKGNWSVTRREGNGLIQTETKISSVQGRPLTAYTSSDGRIILRDDKKGRKR